jgi:hypothetical protein
MVYGTLRERFRLSSQMAVRAISKDERVMSFKGVSHVSLLTINSGRVLVPIRFGAYQASRRDRIKGQADLILRNGVFYLHVCVDMPTPPPADTSGGVLGVDLGIVGLATDSEGQSYSGAAVKSCRRRLKEHRRHLQRRQTNSAKKRLRRLTGRQARFVRDTNHVISKRIVQTALAFQKESLLNRWRGYGSEHRFLVGSCVGCWATGLFTSCGSS